MQSKGRVGGSVEMALSFCPPEAIDQSLKPVLSRYWSNCGVRASSGTHAPGAPRPGGKSPDDSYVPPDFSRLLYRFRHEDIAFRRIVGQASAHFHGG